MHIGHLLASHAAAEACQLDKVLVVPCALSPFKQGETNLATAEDRLAMVRLSIGDDPLLELSTIDLERGGVSYALDTVKGIKRVLPKAELFFIIGMDSLEGLHRWHKIRELLKLCNIITLERPGSDLPLDTIQTNFPAEINKRLLQGIIPGRYCNVSASEIRTRVAERRSIRYLVTRAVEEYIYSRSLYIQ